MVRSCYQHGVEFKNKASRDRHVRKFHSNRFASHPTVLIFTKPKEGR